MSGFDQPENDRAPGRLAVPGRGVRHPAGAVPMSAAGVRDLLDERRGDL